MHLDPSAHALLLDAGTVTRVQVAVDGRWEGAIRVSATDGASGASALAAHLRARGEFAVEVFAADASGCQTFLGVRFHDAARRDAGVLLSGVCGAAFARSATLTTVAEWLSRHCEVVLFSERASRAEIGVIDAWASMGSRVVSNRSWTDTSHVQTALLNTAQALAARAGHVVALELASDQPVPHWVGIEVARSTGEQLVPSVSLGRAVTAMLCRA